VKHIFSMSLSRSEPHTLWFSQSCVPVPPRDLPCPLAHDAAKAAPSWLATALALLALHRYKPKHTALPAEPCPVWPHPSCSRSDHETRHRHFILGPALLCPKVGSSWTLYYRMQNSVVIFFFLCIGTSLKILSLIPS